MESTDKGSNKKGSNKKGSTEKESPKKKKPYHKPELTEYGAVETLTQGTMSMGFDFGFGMMS